MLSCLVVQPFLLAMPADVDLAIKAKNNCSEFTWVVQQGLSAQYTILVKCFPLSLSLETIEVWPLFCAMPSNKLETLLGGAVKFVPRLPPSLLAALLFNISCKPILQSDPARAVLHSARSAGEISEVVWSRHRQKSHRLNQRKAVLPHLMPTCHYLFYNSITSHLTCIIKEQRH